MVTDLQTKVEKYETKAAQCEESARQATDEPQRAFYQVLARACRHLGDSQII